VQQVHHGLIYSNLSADIYLHCKLLRRQPCTSRPVSSSLDVVRRNAALRYDPPPAQDIF
jgi:hypothetical protein